MRYLSVCSGIEAATVAWHPLGWKAVGFADIDKYARALLSFHYQDVPLHSDFTQIKEINDEPIDLLVGGTPCQAFSMAGLRKGLEDHRGNLTLEFIRLAQRTRPRWLVWENVPGVLSIDKGRTFGTFLGGLAECGYGFAYRVLDAQYFGVPQRRRRVFVIGYLGNWRYPAAALFERESLCRNITPSRKKGERIASTLMAGSDQCSGVKGGIVEQEKVVPQNENYKVFEPGKTSRGFGSTKLSEICSTLRATMGDNQPAIVGNNLVVRRLTPRECERLQGFPDDYTLIPYRNKMVMDGPRYKALGNSMAVPVMKWLGERIKAVESNIQAENV